MTTTDRSRERQPTPTSDRTDRADRADRAGTPDADHPFGLTDDVLAADFARGCELDGVVPYLLNSVQNNRMARLGDIFDRLHLGAVSLSAEPRIPKVIHQIWLGGAYPDKYAAFQQRWRELHPGWEYRLWTDAELSSYDFQTGDLIHRCRNPGERSDIWRAEILHRHGGLYVDCDVDCLRPFDAFHHAYDFYAGIQFSPTLVSSLSLLEPDHFCGISNAVLGASSGHPILTEYLDAAATWFDIYADLPLTRRQRWAIPTLLRGPEAMREMRATMFRTYWLMEDCFFRKHNRDGHRDIILPTTFFNPLDPFRKFRCLLPAFNLAAARLFRDTRGNAYRSLSRVQPESFAVHHYSGGYLG